MDFDSRNEYNQLSTLYDRFYSPHWPFDRKIQGLIDYLKTWPGGERVLELGVGSGNVAGKLYLEGYHHITGTDFSPGMVENLRVKCPKIHLKIEDLLETQFSGYDWILIIGGIIGRIEDKASFFQKLYQQADHDALIFISVPHDWECDADLQHFPSEKRHATHHLHKFQVDFEYVQKSLSHQVGRQTITDRESGQSVIHQYEIWDLIGRELEPLMNQTGFRTRGCGPVAETGYYKDIWVFQK